MNVMRVSYNVSKVIGPLCSEKAGRTGTCIGSIFGSGALVAVPVVPAVGEGAAWVVAFGIEDG